MPFVPDPVFTRRRWQRVPFQSSVTLIPMDKPGPEITAPGIDISQGGMSVTLAQPFASEDKIRVRCCLPRSKYALEAIGKVKYRDGQRCGVQFEALSVRDQRELRKHCSAFIEPGAGAS
jgi:c-di-GMP-binding flagellar brake protein YcgR